MKRRLSVPIGLATLVIFSIRVAAAQDPGGVLTLEEAAALALERSPEMEVFRAEIRASEARVMQAGLRPNPEAALELEDFAGSGAFSGAGEMQSTLALSSVIELGGKRARRREAASAERDLVAQDYELKRIDVIAAVTERFIAVVGVQERLALARETTALEEAELEIVRQRVEAGRTSSLEERKAAVALARGRLEQERAERELVAARTSLAATWGDTVATFDRADADLFALGPVPPIDTLLVRAADSPEAVRWAAEKQLREAEVRLAHAQRVPDPTVGAGVRWLEGPDEHSLVAGVAVPLPFFDRNQGGRAESEAWQARSEAARGAAEHRRRAALLGFHQVLANAQREVTTTRQEILPEAEEALRIADQGYREGRFSYLDLADARRTVLDLRRQQIVAAMEYHLAAVEIERLTGQPLRP